MTYILLKNCRELLTVEENTKDLIGLKKNTSLLIENERIKKIGTYKELKKEIPLKNFQNYFLYTLYYLLYPLCIWYFLNLYMYKYH